MLHLLLSQKYWFINACIKYVITLSLPNIKFAGFVTEKTSDVVQSKWVWSLFITMFLLYVFVLFCRQVFVLICKMFFDDFFLIANILQEFGKEPRRSTNISRMARQDKPLLWLAQYEFKSKIFSNITIFRLKNCLGTYLCFILVIIHTYMLNVSISVV